MIAYVDSETDHSTYKHGLAIVLSDEGSMNWSTAKSTCEGKTAVSGATVKCQEFIYVSVFLKRPDP